MHLLVLGSDQGKDEEAMVAVSPLRSGEVMMSQAVVASQAELLGFPTSQSYSD